MIKDIKMVPWTEFSDEDWEYEEYRGEKSGATLIEFTYQFSGTTSPDKIRAGCDALVKAGWEIEDKHNSTYYKKSFWSRDEGIKEWENLTGLNANEEGCECCGKPYYFTFTKDGKYEQD